MKIDGNNWIEQYGHQTVDNMAVGDTLALGVEQEYHRHQAYYNPKKRVVAYRQAEATDDQEDGCNERDISYCPILHNCPITGRSVIVPLSLGRSSIS